MMNLRRSPQRIIAHLKSKFPEFEYVRSFCRSLNLISTKSGEFYLYPFNPEHKRQILNGRIIICSNTVDYSVVLDSTLAGLVAEVSLSPNWYYQKVEKRLVRGIEKLAKRIDKHDLLRILNSKSLSFEEAIQKLLFYNALFWQANHWHVGLGRLDVVLYPYYINDISSGKITREEAKNMLIQMLNTLDKDVASKSGMMLGDTGQYILIAGIDERGENVCNELTYLFLEIFQNYKRPDPKLIIRVNKKTPDTLWHAAAKCVVQGSGSPLFINEDVVIKSMVEFGYQESDVYNFGTSACWEPLIIGKSFDQNNSLAPLVPIRILNNLILTGRKYNSFPEFLEEFKRLIDCELNELIHDIDFDCSPLYSLFFHSCSLRGKDYSKGGADYNFHGIQVIGFSNTINALLNLKKYVFDEHVISLDYCQKMISSNFAGAEEILKLLKNNRLTFGSTNQEVVSLSNDFMNFISNSVSNYRINGNKVKVGFSSPNFIVSAKGVTASMDGRLDDEPFGVHISPISSNVDFFEILDFSTMLNYGENRINGNVLDFPIPYSFVKNPEKLSYILKNTCHKGAYEIQLSVMDHNTLVDAKLHPEKYPNLIVRVWGFSAYFNDLPEDYKDNIINRTKLYETS